MTSHHIPILADRLADPQSPQGTAFSFSRPKRQATRIANTSLMLEFASSRLVRSFIQGYAWIRENSFHFFSHLCFHFPFTSLSPLLSLSFHFTFTAAFTFTSAFTFPFRYFRVHLSSHLHFHFPFTSTFTSTFNFAFTSTFTSAFNFAFTSLSLHFHLSLTPSHFTF